MGLRFKAHGQSHGFYKSFIFQHFLGLSQGFCKSLIFQHIFALADCVSLLIKVTWSIFVDQLLDNLLIYMQPHDINIIDSIDLNTFQVSRRSHTILKITLTTNGIHLSSGIFIHEIKPVIASVINIQTMGGPG